MASSDGPRVFFGGPDRPPGLLRDLLEMRVDAVPPGGEINWVTYYFRDEGLAEALVRAHRRGVRVHATIEDRPRFGRANQRVRELLARGLGRQLRRLRHAIPLHLHEKLYAFSGPRPTVLIGSFNPSGSAHEDPEVTRAIGDQDRGHNYLVELSDQQSVAALTSHAADLHRHGDSALQRLWPPERPPLPGRGMQFYRFPRRHSRVLIERLRSLGRGSSLRVVASHLRDGAVAGVLCALARAGGRVEVIAHDSRRRVPCRIEDACVRAGIAFHRYAHPLRLPMHNKFILAESGDTRWVAFGSMNLTRTSRWLNRELLAISDDPSLYAAFSARWEAIAAEPCTVSAADAWSGGLAERDVLAR